MSWDGARLGKFLGREDAKERKDAKEDKAALNFLGVFAHLCAFASGQVS
ncbi:MAG TPA: hypothetical protein VJN68_08090 [Burkholderiaceae bacterium]|nr:hypothetical protein [Burkholderiaceae bacterium]